MPDPSSGHVTRLANARTVVAWDEGAGAHVYLSDADVVFADGRLLFVGRGYDGPADETVDARGLMVMPGLVNIHSHPSSEPMNKGLNDEIGSPGLYNSSLYEYMPIFRADEAAQPDCARVAFSEMLLSGVTTVADLSVPYDGWWEVAEESGLRVCFAPMFRSARWYTRNGHVVEYEWDEAAGERAMAQALDLVDRAQGHESGLFSGMVIPAQIDTCSEGLIRDSFAEAAKRDLPWQIHAAQSVVEFHEITRRHGVTPIGWLDQLGVLSDRSIIGHAIFLDDHASTRWSTDSDLDRLADTGTRVAHCPTVFARRGITLRHLGRYIARGIGVSLGTDTYPHDMLSEMRLAAYLARTQAVTPRALTTTDLFNAVTVEAARALGHQDIGRLAAGCRADLVLVDLDHPLMLPAHDPLRALIYGADARVVQGVIVGGRRVVERGQVLTIDHASAAQRLRAAQERVAAAVPSRDWAGRTVDQIAPPTFASR
ncbi:amidohydrolase family protein [Marinivivus vitaminiproducens]|uniref:amidohydrolase family protein n=1 Tax=Marinivivus vitaminiproducens TaxID=3035935 RepID=UPI003FA0ED41